MPLHSFHKPLLSTHCVPGSVPGAGDAAVDSVVLQKHPPALLWVSFLTCEFGLVRGPSLQGGREPECTELPLGRWAAQRVSLVSLGQQVRTTAFLWAQFWVPTSGGPCGPASLLLQQRGGSQRATWSTCPWRDQSCWAWAKLNPPGHLLYR